MTLHPTGIAAIVSALLLTACATTASEPPSTGAASSGRLQAGEWRIEDIGGQGVIDNSPATLVFGSDGRLSGNASCNRLIASYTVQGEKITISPTGLTMMACQPALMNQERKLVDLLNAVSSYRIDDTGALVLRTASGKQVVARR